MTRRQASILIALFSALLVWHVGSFVFERVQSVQAEVGSTDRATATYGDETDDFVIPYDGYLMLDSTPLNGGIELRFELYEFDPSINNIAATPEWTETQTITAYNGRFSVGLGATTSINSTLLDADQLYLAISIGDGAGNYTPLGGYQAIEPVPYAIWSAHAANLNVAGTLATGGSVTLGDASTDTHTANGSLTVTNALQSNGSATLGDNASDSHTANGSLDVTNSLEVDGTSLLRQYVTTEAGLGVGGWLSVKGTDVYLGTNTSGGLAMSQESGNTLYINGERDFTGGIALDGYTAVHGNFDVNGTLLKTAGDIQVNGDDVNSDNSLLRLNVTRNLPIQVPTIDSTLTATYEGGAAVHFTPVADRNTSVIGTTACNTTNHGALTVAKVSTNSDREALCVCMRGGLTTGIWYEWMCFNR